MLASRGVLVSLVAPGIVARHSATLGVTAVMQDTSRSCNYACRNRSTGSGARSAGQFAVLRTYLRNITAGFQTAYQRRSFNQAERPDHQIHC